ncbi:MAG: hypothetical protein NZM25_11125 [Leptospiraceae bacterium]|nr:hypothetical protein [Leptospiraceae bacterium]MDW8305980.1 hypothetical protein [Leptospiraceae bacterium]
MWKRQLLLLLVFFLSFRSLHPTYTRSAGYGIDRAISWMIDGQFPFIFENPAFMIGYENNIYLEYFNTIRMGGIFIGLPQETTLGIFSGSTTDFTTYNTADFQSLFHGVSDDPARIDFANANFLGNGALSTTPLNMRAAAADIRNPEANLLENRNVELLANRSFGKWQAGAGVGYGFARDEQFFKDTQNSNEERVDLFKSEFRLVLGLLIPLNTDILRNIAGSAVFTKHTLSNIASKTFNNVPAQGGYESDGAFDAGLRLRTSSSFRKSLLHTHLGYTYLNRSGRSYVTTNYVTSREGIYERKGHRFQIGLANEIPLTEKLSLFWGSEFFYESFHNVYKAKAIPNVADSRNFDTTVYLIRMPLVLGIGANLTESFALRFGIRHNVVNSGNNYESSTQVSNGTIVTSRSQFLSAASSLSFGLSYFWGPLSFDWLANISLLQKGPYFVSGQINDMALAFAVSFRYGSLISPKK